MVAGIGLFGLPAAPQWWMVPIIISLVGVGSGLIDAVTNAQTSLHRSLGYMGWLHASWAAGAAIGPPLIALSLALSSSWRLGFAAMGFAFAAVAAFVGREGGHRASVAGNPLPTPALEQISPKVGRPLLLLAGLFLLGAGLEATAGDWAYSQLTLGRGLSAQVASLAASLFWAGLGAGRVALGLLGNRASPTLVLDGSIALTLIASLSFWFAPPLACAIIALPLIGVAVSVFFPVLLSITPTRVGREMTSHAVGYGLAAGTVGAGGIPAIGGIILQSLGLLTLGPLLVVIAGALAVLHALSRRSGDGQRSAPPAADR